MRNQWKELMPSLGVLYDLGKEECPVSLLLDLSLFRPGDHVIVTTKIHSENNIIIDDIMDVTFNTVGEDEEAFVYMFVNGAPISRGKLLEIRPHDGPWRCQFTYKQVQQFNKKIKFKFIPRKGELICRSYIIFDRNYLFGRTVDVPQTPVEVVFRNSIHKIMDRTETFPRGTYS